MTLSHANIPANAPESLQPLRGPGAEAAISAHRVRARLLPFMQRFGGLGALVLLIIITTIVTPAFLSGTSIRSQLQNFCLFYGLVCIGQTLVILTGGVDLSVGAVVAVGSCLAAQLVMQGQPMFLVFVLPVVVGTFLGSVNGFVIARARVQPIVVTLAMMIAARGLAELITGGGVIQLSDLDFGNVATTALWAVPYLGTVPISLVIVIVAYAGTAFFLARTVMGRYIFAVGSNERATRISGVTTERVKILVYAVSGLLAALAGVLFASFNSTADPFNDGLLYELWSISAVVVGGTSLLGGRGSIWRTLTGGLILSVLFALFVQIGWQKPIQDIAQGLIIAAAVMLQGGGES